MWTLSRSCKALGLLSLLGWVTYAEDPTMRPETVRGALLVAVSRFVPGRTFDVGIRLDIPAGWHIYWRNPGDVGLPTELEWELPPGFRAGPIEWPLPKRFQDGGVTSFGYDGTVVFPVRIETPLNWAAGRFARIRVHVSWLQCREICVPGSVWLERQLPADDAHHEPSEEAAILAEARRQLPRLDPMVSASFESGADRLRVLLRGLGTNAPGLLLPYEGGFVPASATPQWRSGLTDGEWVAELPRSGGFPIPSEWRALLLLSENGGVELEIRQRRGNVRTR